jgi:hypothetical protein
MQDELLIVCERNCLCHEVRRDGQLAATTID